MYKILMCLLFVFLSADFGTAQEFNINRKTEQLIETRDIHLNGGMRSQFGGKSRTYIQVDLPKNTVKWMYSFTTAKGQNGTKGLNLAVQLSSLALDPTTFSANMLSNIEVPDGVASIDVYLCDRSNIYLFLNRDAYSYTMEGSVENTKHAVIVVDDVRSGTVFLGLKNPSSMNGVNISIEVVAITETKIAIPMSKEQEKAELFGTLGWAHFMNGDYQKCIEYCNKSKKEYAFGWVLANKGLAQLIESEEEKAFDSYIEAIPLIKKQSNPKRIFRKMLKDLDAAVKLCIQLDGASVVKDLIKLELN